MHLICAPPPPAKFFVTFAFHFSWVLPPSQEKLGTLRSDDGDGNGNATKAVGLISKTTILHVHHAFLYISLPSLHDYDVKMPNFTMYRGSTQATSKFPLSFWTWIWFLGIQLLEGSPSFDKVSDFELSRWRSKERAFTFSATFSLPSPSSDLKVPIENNAYATFWGQISFIMGSVEVAYKKHDWVGNTFMVAGRCGLLTNRRAE